MLKYLRIAVTALGLTACVLLAMVPMRSHRFVDAFKVPFANKAVDLRASTKRVSVWLFPLDEHGRFKSYGPNDYRGISAPYSVVLLLTTLLTGMLLIRSRFSLRTLLIAMTLVAVGLGLFVAF